MATLRTGSVLVTGSNRGIGLELVKQLLATASPLRWLFATCRDPKGPRAQELRNLALEHSNMVLIQLEVTDPTGIQAALGKVESKLGESGLNLLINNAGVVSREWLDNTNRQDMLNVYDTNVVGPLLVSQYANYSGNIGAFLPLLKKAAQQSPTEPMGCSRAALIHISSDMGSLGLAPKNCINYGNRMIPYKASKAALNMLTRCQAEAYRKDGILCASINPGWVKTDMGTESAPLTVEAGVGGVLSVLCSLTDKNTEAMINWDGQTLPW